MIQDVQVQCPSNEPQVLATWRLTSYNMYQVVACGGHLHYVDYYFIGRSCVWQVYLIDESADNFVVFVTSATLMARPKDDLRQLAIDDVLRYMRADHT